MCQPWTLAQHCKSRYCRVSRAASGTTDYQSATQFPALNYRGSTFVPSQFASLPLVRIIGEYLVPGVGLEPTKPQEPGDFKSPAYTSSATRAR